jgi:purine-binding chemotaxis protein CheW
MNSVARHTATRTHWVTFALDSRRFALPLDAVSRVIRAAEITPLHRAPDVVAGALDVGGRILPVFDLRQRLRLPPRALGLSDQFIIACARRGEVVITADSVLGLVEAEPQSLEEAGPVLSLPDGLALIQDLDGLLSAGEQQALDSALRRAEVDDAG